MDRTTSIVPFFVFHRSPADTVYIYRHTDIGTDNPIIAGRTRSCQKPDRFDRRVQMMKDYLRAGRRPYVCIR